MSQRGNGPASPARPGRNAPGAMDPRMAMARQRARTGSAPAVSAAALAQAQAARRGYAAASSSAALPNWFWGLMGCMSVLVVGFAGLWWATTSGLVFGRVDLASGSENGRTGSSSTARGQIQVEQIGSPPPPPAAVVARNEARRMAPRPRPAVVPAGLPHSAKVPATKLGAPAAADDKAAQGAGADNDSDEGAAADQAKQVAAVRDVSPAPAAEAPSMPAVLRQISGPDDEEAKPRKSPTDVVKAGLTALAPRIRRCFYKFQIPGKAEVQLVATPAGVAESVSVTGDFEGTPTGDCIADQVSAASLPSFTGSPVRMTYTYNLR